MYLLFIAYHLENKLIIINIATYQPINEKKMFKKKNL